MLNEDGHTVKQALFIVEYCKDFNGTQAAIRAGYSEHTAPVIAAENLKKPYVRAGIDRKLAEIAATAHVSATWALNERLEIIALAKKNNDLGAANTALTSVEKTHLQMVDKSEATVKIDHTGTNEEIQRMLANAAAAKASSGNGTSAVDQCSPSEADNA